MSTGAHRRVSRPTLVLLQLLVFLTYIFGPTATLGEEPVPEPTPTESPAPEPTAEPTPEPTLAPTPEPTTAPDPTPAPSEPDPTLAPSEPDPTPAPSEPAPTPTAGTRPYLVTFASGTADARQLEILAAAGVTDEAAIPQLAMRSVLLHEAEVTDELAALRANADVVRVDLDRTRAVDAAPSDTSYADQWSLPQVGWDQLYGTVGIGGSSIVAILDTGIDAAHQDLDGVVLPGISVLDGSNGLTDPNGHGTWMAGIVAAETDNAFGIAGTAYAGVSLLPVTVLGADGTGQDSDIIAGVVYAADAGADVILMSFSNPGYSPALQAAIDYAWDSGSVLVAATGNDGSGVATFPAGDRGVIGVTSTDSVDALAAGANYGPAAFMAAPGVDITTTSTGGSVAAISGTSAAAAQVAGAAALLSANEPFLSNGVIVGRLARNADPAGDPAQTGNGRLNLARAMADASLEEIQPAGAAPVGAGGPLVGPYVIAAGSLDNDGTFLNGVRSVDVAGGATISATVRVDSGNANSNNAVRAIGWRVATTAPGTVTCVDIVDVSDLQDALRTFDITAPAGSGVYNTYFKGYNNNTCSTGPQATNDLMLPNSVVIGGVSCGGNIICVNGHLGDWDALTTTPAYADFVGDQGGGSGDIRSIRITSGNGNVYIRWDVALVSNKNNVSSDGFSVTVDADRNGVADARGWVLFNSSGVPTVQVERPFGTFTTVGSAAQSCTFSSCVNGGLASIEASFPITAFNATDAIIGLQTETRASQSTSSSVKDCVPGSGSPTPCNGYFNLDTDTGTTTVTVGHVTTTTIDCPDASVTVNQTTSTCTVTVHDTGVDTNGAAVTVAHPTGTVNFSVSGGSGAFSPTSCTLSPAVAAADSTCTLTYTPSTTGTHQLKASYAGDTSPIQFASSSGTDLLVVNAANSAPTVAADEATVTVNEGQSAVNTGTYSDANAGDDIVITASVGIVTKTGTNSGTWSWSFATTDGPDQSQTVTITADDGTATPVTTTFALTVNNVAPTVTLSAANDLSVNEGSQHTYSFTSSDPGNDTFALLSTDCGLNGSQVGGDTFDTTTGAGSFVCAFADGPASSIVSVQVEDSDGADSNTASQTVSVANLSPFVTLSAANEVSLDEGSQHTYSFTSSDPGNDTFALLSTDCGLNGSQVGADTFNTTTGAGSFVCSFPDGPASSTVSVQVEDSDGADSNTDTQAVTINNVKPSITLSGADTADEGDTKTYTYLVTDPGVDDHSVTTACGANGTKVTGSDSYNPLDGSGLFQCFFPDGDTTTNVTATVTDSDGATDTDNQVVVVTISNLDPIVTLAGADSVNEGDTVSYSYTVSDPGSETFALDVETCDGGTLSNSIFNPADGSGSFDCTFADGPASHDVSVTVSDGDGGSGSDTITVSVANLDPIVTLAGADSANEGDTVSYSYTVSDPGSETFALDVETCDGGTLSNSIFNPADGSGSFDCTFADGPASHDVSVTVSDGDGGSGSDTITVSVANVKPSITLSGADTADEGDTKTYTYLVTDPGVDDHSVTTACGANGTKVTGSDSYNPLDGSGLFQCFFPDGDTTTNVTATVTDSDGATDTDNQVVVVTISNLDPIVTLAGADSVNEGDTVSYSYTVSDPGSETFALDVETCDGGTLSNSIFNPADGSGSFDCTFADGPASHDVSVTVSDGDGGSGSDTITVSVANLDPIVTLAGADSANEGDTVSYSYTVSDPGSETFALDVETCDGGTLSNSIFNPADGSGSFDCTFADGPASHDVSVTVSDGDGGSGSDTITVSVANVKPSITLSGADTADEGDTKTYTYLVTDPGVDDHSVTTACGANGTKVTGSDSYNPLDGSGLFQCFFPDGDTTTNVTATVTDSDGATDTDNQVVVVTISNLDPIVTLAGADSVNEGDTVSYSYTVSDAGSETFALDVETCDGGTLSNSIFNPADGSGSFDCTFADGPASHDVSVTVSDGDGGSGSDTITVSVANLDPIVTLAGADSANEGDTVSYSYTVSDPGSETFALDVETCDGGTLSNSIFNPADGSGSFDCTFADGPASHDVSVTVSDGDGGSGSDTITVSVANLDPIVTLAGADSANEGDTVSYSYTVSDPGSETFALDVETCDGGTLSNSIFNPADGSGSFDCTFADGPASHDVSVTVSDGDGGSGSDTITVSVANLDPIVTLAGADSANEGDTVSYSYTVSDPGSETFALDVETCDGGTLSNSIFNPADGSGSFDCTFADGPASHDVSVTVSDGDGGSGSDTITVSVANVKPSITLSGADTADEGDTKTYTYLVTDPGVDDHSVTTACGANGTKVTGSDSYNPLDGSGLFQCFFPDGDTTTNVTATVTDSDGATDTDNQVVVVTISNLDPIVTLAGADSVNEGDTVSYSYTVSDPGSETFALDVETCDGGTLSNSIFNPADGSGSFDCTFADGPASHDVSVTVSDGDGGSGSDTITVSVANLDPIVTLAGADSANEGDTVSYSYTVSDPGSETFALDVETCDGGTLSNSIFNPADGSGSFDCTFADGPASHDVSVTVSDGDGGSGSDTITVSVANLDPIVTLAGPTSSNEGQTKHYTFSWTDPGADAWTRTVSCGPTGVISASNILPSSKSGSFDCTWADDAPTSTASDIEIVSVTVSDADGGSGSASQNVTIYNVAPVINEPATTATFAPGTGTVTSSLSYADAGVLDSETAAFKYTWTGTSSGTETHTYSGRASTAVVGDSMQLAPGCYSILVEMSVTDDDTGADTTSRTSGATSIDFYDATFRAPIQENVRNIAKYGNVVPVKVELLSMCIPGTTITNRTLHITIVLGDQTDNANDLVPDTMIAESVSGADTGTQMRLYGNGFIYNLSTRGMAKDNEYTIRIRDGSNVGPIVLKALFMPKK